MGDYYGSVFGTERDKVNCSFYLKIGACRHGDRCSRVHNKPAYSETILLQNLYVNPKNQAKTDGKDVSDEEVQRHFDEFFEDIFVELSDKYGPIKEMNVCDNLGDHLIGNVYVKFKYEEDAEKAVEHLNDRWFGGKPVYAELSTVTDFRDAGCRQYEIDACTRGGFCNFMHIKQISRRLERDLFGSSRRRSAQRSHRSHRSRSRSGSIYSARSSLSRGRSRSPYRSRSRSISPSRPRKAARESGSGRHRESSSKRKRHRRRRDSPRRRSRSRSRSPRPLTSTVTATTRLLPLKKDHDTSNNNNGQHCPDVLHSPLLGPMLLPPPPPPPETSDPLLPSPPPPPPPPVPEDDDADDMAVPLPPRSPPLPPPKSRSRSRSHSPSSRNHQSSSSTRTSSSRHSSSRRHHR